MCERKQLYKGLQLVLADNQIGIFDKSGHNVVKKIKKHRVRTMSKTNVFMVDCVTSTHDKFSIVVKKQDSEDIERKSGLKYEKKMYNLMTQIVDVGACPFRIRNYNMSEPDTVLVTETFSNVIDLREYLVKLDEISGEKHKNACKNLLIQILYAIEVNFRIGVRHNDLHLHNVLIRKCPSIMNYHLMYVTRDKKKYKIEMPNCDIMTLFFDNDRVTKLPPRNSKILNIFKCDHSPQPVLNLFPWHEPRVRTERLDLFKIMQLLYDNTQSNYLRKLCVDLNIAFSSSQLQTFKNKLAQGTELVAQNFERYRLVTNFTKPANNGSHHKEPLAPPCSQKSLNLPCTVGGTNHKAAFPSFLLKQLSSSEDAILNIASKQIVNKKSVKIGDMTKLYAKNTIVTTPRSTRKPTNITKQS